MCIVRVDVFFFFKQKTAYEMLRSLVGSEMCIRDRDGFTKQHKVHDLVYFETTESIESAITREKKLKKWNREWKIKLIEKDNPEWRDLYAGLV